MPRAVITRIRQPSSSMASRRSRSASQVCSALDMVATVVLDDHPGRPVAEVVAPDAAFRRRHGRSRSPRARAARPARAASAARVSIGESHPFAHEDAPHTAPRRAAGRLDAAQNATSSAHVVRPLAHQVVADHARGRRDASSPASSTNIWQWSDTPERRRRPRPERPERARWQQMPSRRPPVSAAAGRTRARRAAQESVRRGCGRLTRGWRTPMESKATSAASTLIRGVTGTVASTRTPRNERAGTANRATAGGSIPASSASRAGERASGVEVGTTVMTRAFPVAAPACRRHPQPRFRRVSCVTDGPHPRIAAVVVTFNRLPLLQRLVARLREEAGLAEIIVVDNASTDGTGEWLAAEAAGDDGPPWSRTPGPQPRRRRWLPRGAAAGRRARRRPGLADGRRRAARARLPRDLLLEHDLDFWGPLVVDEADPSRLVFPIRLPGGTRVVHRTGRRRARGPRRPDPRRRDPVQRRAGDPRAGRADRAAPRGVLHLGRRPRVPPARRAGRRADRHRRRRPRSGTRPSATSAPR